MKRQEIRQSRRERRGEKERIGEEKIREGERRILSVACSSLIVELDE